jgi:hypothetical protein
MLDQKQEAIQSVTSYGIGAGMAGFATLADIASTAQSLAIIGGCLVVAIRLIHDGVALHRFIKDPKRKRK